MKSSSLVQFAIPSNRLYKKISVQYYRALKHSIKNYRRSLVYYVIMCTALLLFISIYYTATEIKIFLPTLIVSTVCEFLLTIYNAIMVYRLYMTNHALRVAEQLSHIVYEQNQPKNETSLQAILSSRYTQNQVSQPILIYSEQNRIAEVILTATIDKRYTTTLMRCVKVTSIGISVALIFFYIYGIALFVYDSTIGVFIVTFIVVESLSKLQSLLIVFLIACSPFFILLISFCKCYHGNSYTLPQLQRHKLTNDVMIYIDYCGFCAQTFILGDIFVVLPCHPKHAYHEFCINHWLKISPTCFVCKKYVNL